MFLCKQNIFLTKKSKNLREIFNGVKTTEDIVNQFNARGFTESGAHIGGLRRVACPPMGQFAPMSGGRSLVDTGMDLLEALIGMEVKLSAGDEAFGCRQQFYDEMREASFMFSLSLMSARDHRVVCRLVSFLLLCEHDKIGVATVALRLSISSFKFSDELNCLCGNKIK